MKNKILYALLCIVLLINAILPTAIFADGDEMDTPPSLASDYAILIDADSGRVLYEKNADTRAYPASTTKIMTAILAIENLDLNEKVTASYDAVMSLPYQASNMGVSEGEILTVEELLWGCIVYSANECCNILGEHISGSIDNFVDKMNEKAKEIGMANTHFVNANGLHDDNHYTTARDMAILARYAMKNETFRNMVSTYYHEIQPSNKYDQVRYLTTTNYLINPQSGYYYKYATGIKTGYTSSAANCLVSSASKNGANLIAVTLHAEYHDDGVYSFIDSKKLFEYGFDNYKIVSFPDSDDPIAEVGVKYGKGFDYVSAVPKGSIGALLPVNYDKSKIEHTINLNSEKVEAPVKAGDILGTVSYSYDGEEIGMVNLVAFTDVSRNWLTYIIGKFFFIITYPVRLIFRHLWLGIPVSIILVLFIALRITRAVNIRRRKKRRAKSLHAKRSEAKRK